MAESLPTADDFEDGPPKEPRVSPDLHPLTDEEVANIITSEIKDAETFKASGIASEQSEAIRYYYGRPFGNEIKDRSSVILTDVRDTIAWILPTLMRMFLGGRQVVRYVPQGPEDVEWAKQATDYAQYIMRRGNCGFVIFHDWLK